MGRFPGARFSGCCRNAHLNTWSQALNQQFRAASTMGARLSFGTSASVKFGAFAERPMEGFAEQGRGVNRITGMDAVLQMLSSEEKFLSPLLEEIIAKTAMEEVLMTGICEGNAFAW